jgi:thioredoxin-dependent peroxiredoxin
MAKQESTVTFQGKPLTLLGSPRKPGDKAPDCTLIANDLSEHGLGEHAGKVRLINVVPSLDTGVCNAQTRRFDEELGKLGNDVVGITVSADLPFAQKRWADDAALQHFQVLSDYRDMAFGQAFGTHIEELRLDARAVFVVDKDGTIRHAEYVSEMTDHPDYDAALEVVRELT